MAKAKTTDTPEAEVPAADAASEPSQVAMPDMDPPPVPPARRRRWWPVPVAAVLLAGAGFGGAWYLAQTQPGLIGLKGSAGMEQRLSDQDKRITDLAQALAAKDQGGGAELAQQAASSQAAIKALGDRMDALETRLAAVDARLARIESVPIAQSGATAADLAAATEAANRAAKSAQDEAARIKADAEKAARHAQALAALGQVQAALESGVAMDAALAQLSDAGVTVPESLTSQAQGVPTLTALKTKFPDAARDALSASLGETASGGLWDRMKGFLRSQTGQRSLTPRAGTDPDAILSRAESALNSADLKTAMTEISALPEAGRARLAEWVGLASRRQAALDAAAKIADDVK